MPLFNACHILAAAGAVAVVVQTRVLDQDFLAEFSAYYSRQFSSVSRYCTRMHFFASPTQGEVDTLRYLDNVPKGSYLGFITLRPVIKSPLGASIIACSAAGAFVRCVDQFPVNIGGAEFTVVGTPFMQQDNAVGACAQASIWMALRTLRKREGDRAYDPAQITDAATKYFVSGRVRPNRQGLTQQQIVEAIRAAGYSPHTIPLGTWHGKRGQMSEFEIMDSMRTLHAYIESDIPVILILFPKSGGHAVVAIGHTWSKEEAARNPVCIKLQGETVLEFRHAASWVPSFVIHNDNAGPYRQLQKTYVDDYALEHAAFAIPLLPVDVFMSGEEAMTVATEVLASVFQGFKEAGAKTEAELQAIAKSLVLRLRLVEKRKLRRWAASEKMVPELSQALRMMEMPKRVWALEIHQADEYGKHDHGAMLPTLVGLILVDPTADIIPMSTLLMHLNLPALFGLRFGVLMTWDIETGNAKQGIQTEDTDPILPILR
ncbi:MAG TPA: C39 family peptidase [Noviherbaspirillum sp.]|nr:C39 family peptidase [Noviherbaspirillum sp.]